MEPNHRNGRHHAGADAGWGLFQQCFARRLGARGRTKLLRPDDHAARVHLGHAGPHLWRRIQSTDAGIGAGHGRRAGQRPAHGHAGDRRIVHGPLPRWLHKRCCERDHGRLAQSIRRGAEPLEHGRHGGRWLPEQPDGLARCSDHGRLPAHPCDHHGRPAGYRIRPRRCRRAIGRRVEPWRPSGEPRRRPANRAGKRATAAEHRAVQRRERSGRAAVQ